jgi:SsrA-binding protein
LAKDHGAGRKVIARNRRASHDYFLEERIEAGLVLQGTEVKSLREGRANINEAYASEQGGELYLLNATIPEYRAGNIFNHEPRRARKLLLHRREIERLLEASAEKGLTIVPTRIYFNGPRAKVELALAKGKDTYDKRRAIKDRDTKREIERALSERY